MSKSLLFYSIINGPLNKNKKIHPKKFLERNNGVLYNCLIWERECANWTEKTLNYLVTNWCERFRSKCTIMNFQNHVMMKTMTGRIMVYNRTKNLKLLCHFQNHIMMKTMVVWKILVVQGIKVINNRHKILYIYTQKSKTKTWKLCGLQGNQHVK